MDPVSLAADAVALITPYLLDFGKDASKEVAADAGKSVWSWIKGKLTSPAGEEAISDLESAPNKQENSQALQAALAKALKKDPDAAAALADLLKSHGAALTLATSITGSDNIVGQATGGSSVNISKH